MLPLTTKQHDELLRIYRKDPDPELRFRAHLILLLAGGHAWDTIEAMLFCSSRTVDRWLKRFQAEGVAGLTGRKRGRPFRLGLGWVAVLVSWVTTKTPSDFGFLRSRWSCALLAVLLREREGVTASRETVRRWLHRGRLVYRRPRPVLKPDEEERQAKLAELRKLLVGLPDDETAVWQDEVEVHTNPKIGRMWMLVGQQAEVETPGTNKKRHLSGSIPWRTGTLFVTEAAPKQGRNGALFIKHLDERRRRLRRYRKIHVICDNAGGHTSLEVIQYLWKWEGRIEVHLLPSYSPDLNPIERVWWHLHENITRNHRCKDLGELLDRVFAWLGQESPFQIEGSVYPKANAA
ncbi:MAG TPA: IS630 family transposase [Candidatus Methylomirabilis sp.]|jgi:transposase|nr:IS630 family transposase [Candidatus Methylomirabilis sp.]